MTVSPVSPAVVHLFGPTEEVVHPVGAAVARGDFTAEAAEDLVLPGEISQVSGLTGS